MFQKYNEVMRDKSKNGDTKYCATLHLVCSAILKRSRISPPPPGNVLYRGLCDMALPDDFFEPDEQGCAGGTECAFMSTTTDRNVALGFSGVGDRKALPTL